jgi:hypothetical protein
MSSLSPKDRVSLCMFIYPDGRSCRAPRISSHPYFCYDHAQREFRTVTADKLAKDLVAFFSGHFVSGNDLSAGLARLLPAVVRGETKPRTARTVANPFTSPKPNSKTPSPPTTGAKSSTPASPPTTTTATVTTPAQSASPKHTPQRPPNVRRGGDCLPCKGHALKRVSPVGARYNRARRRRLRIQPVRLIGRHGCRCRASARLFAGQTSICAPRQGAWRVKHESRDTGHVRHKVRSPNPREPVQPLESASVERRQIARHQFAQTRNRGSYKFRKASRKPLAWTGRA